MKVTLNIIVTKDIDQQDREIYEEFLSDGDITALYECFDPECEGKHELVFEE